MLKEYTKRDKMKEQACHKGNVTLIKIPYWWDQTLSTLKNLIETQTSKSIAELELNI
jgi:hypothetical protein